MKDVADDTQAKTADLYRMATPDHLCPFGLKAKDLLLRQGFEVRDHLLTNRADTDAFKAEHDVATTPQTFVNGRRIGGYDELREHFGEKVLGKDDVTYRPVIAIFAMSFLMGLAVSWSSLGTIFSLRSLEAFGAIAMCVLAIQKLRDIEGFSTMFLNYDLLARRWVRYGYIYPYAEAFAGVLMLAGAFTFLAAPVALFIGGIGAVSVLKAVYVDKRELKCACVGGDTNVPLGAVSLSENLMMVAMGIWMLVNRSLM